MADRVYCYPDSDVLVNKLGIREKEKLSVFEKKLTMLRLLEIVDNPMEGEFDFAHLKAIHRYIFQDLYEWAGMVRTVDIAKGNMFCSVRFLEAQAEEIFGKLRKDRFLEGLERGNFVKKIAYYFAEINALHPFREGNGRSQREFIRCLALKNGYVINFSEVPEKMMLQASQESFLCEYRTMEEVFARCVHRRRE